MCDDRSTFRFCKWSNDEEVIDWTTSVQCDARCHAINCHHGDTIFFSPLVSNRSRQTYGRTRITKRSKSSRMVWTRCLPIQIWWAFQGKTCICSWSSSVRLENFPDENTSWAHWMRPVCRSCECSVCHVCSCRHLLHWGIPWTRYSIFLIRCLEGLKWDYKGTLH